MKCRDTKKILSVFLSSRLDKTIPREIEDHLNICAKCSIELEELSNTITLLKRWEVPKAPPNFADKVMKRVQEYEQNYTAIYEKNENKSCINIFVKSIIKSFKNFKNFITPKKQTY